MAEGVSNDVTIRWCFARGNGIMLKLITATLNDLFANALTTPQAVVHIWVLTHSSSGPIFTNAFASGETIQSLLTVPVLSFVLRRVSSVRHILLFTYHVLCLFVLILLFFWQILDGEYRYRLGVVREYLLLGRETLFKNLSMNEVATSTGTAKLRTTPSTTLTIESHILTCSDIIPTTLAFSLVAFSKSSRLFVCIVFRYSVSRKSSRMNSDPAIVSKTFFMGCILLAIRPTENETL